MLPWAAFAQEPLPDFEQLRADLSGTDVTVQGYIGTGLDIMDDEAITLVMTSDRAAFPVVFDAGREARRQLDGCEFNSFTGGTPCLMTGKAGLEWDGGRIRLIIFAVDSILPPAEMARQ
jgi:hypothetical protein